MYLTCIYPKQYHFEFKGLVGDFHLNEVLLHCTSHVPICIFVVNFCNKYQYVIKLMNPQWIDIDISCMQINQQLENANPRDS